MGIKRNASGGTYISEPGEYRVRVVTLTDSLSKKGQPMMTVTFQTEDEKSIQTYFVKTLGFHVNNMKILKEACGVDEKKDFADILQKECGILVEGQEPDPSTQRVFMHVVGYGPISELENKR